MSYINYHHQPLTSIYHKSQLLPTSSDPLHLLVLIPGNPGLVDFYITYLNLVQQKFPKFELLTIGHAGFQSHKGPFKFYNLEFQINHKYQIIKRIILKKEKVIDLYFLSHSVGSYITQRLIKKLIEDNEISDKFNIKFIGLICPAIVDIAKSGSGKLFTALYSYLPIVQIVLVLAKILNLLLPDSIAKSIIENKFISKPRLQDNGAIESWENAVAGAFKIYKSSQIIEQALTLAKEEMAIIGKDDVLNDWFFKDLVVCHKVKIWTFFAIEDHWVHDSTRSYILSNYHDETTNGLRFTIGNIEDGITHSFCVDQSVEFSKITVNILKEFFPKTLN